MHEELIISIITLVSSLLGTFSGMKLMSYRIEQLEKKVEKLSTLIERMAVTENKITTAEHRICELEELTR